MPTELDLNSLYKVLKDETRKKVVLALHDKGSLTYSDLMATVQVDSTGRFNYHLKVLNGLISKTEDSKYVLSDKGESAYRLLNDFPEAQSFTGFSKEQFKKFSIIAGLGQVAIITTAVLLYIFGYLDIPRAILLVVATIFTLILTYFQLRNYGTIRPGTRKEFVASRFLYTVGPACIAGFIAFFVDIIINQIASLLKVPSPTQGSWMLPSLALVFIVAPVIGGVFGYVYGKRTGFKLAKSKTF